MKATIHFLDGSMTEYESEELALLVWYLMPREKLVAFRVEGDSRPVEGAVEESEPF